MEEAQDTRVAIPQKSAARLPFAPNLWLGDAQTFPLSTTSPCEGREACFAELQGIAGSEAVDLADDIALCNAWAVASI